MPVAKAPASEAIEAALRAATGPMSILEICKSAFGRAGARERNLVLVNLHRLDARGILVKHPQTYEIRD